MLRDLVAISSQHGTNKQAAPLQNVKRALTTLCSQHVQTSVHQRPAVITSNSSLASPSVVEEFDVSVITITFNLPTT
ncbi:unnamed protein product [Haemonchus placei]|uniref:Uncharacterized protein n=1 Tax=Haemonchus placei TaxID=6290 RepID=A0A3P7YPI8_HAEPC|nr:unnamed protein product [Haemonchus placei]